MRQKYPVIGRVGDVYVPHRSQKQHLSDLALYGGQPLFQQPLFVGRPNVGQRHQLHAFLDEILDTHRLSNNGPFVREFERRICEKTGARHCIAVTNATVGLQLLLQSLEIKGHVIVPSFTFVATVHAVASVGLQPVFADVEPDSHCLDPASVAAIIGDDTGAILATHLWGQCCDVDSLQQLANACNVPLLFDAAHAFGCGTSQHTVGRLGVAEVFSFHATKVVNCFEGGAVTTNNDGVAERLRLARNFGFAGVDHVIGVGTNAKMHEMSAAMGLTSLDAYPEIVDINRRHHAQYRSRLEPINGIRFLSYERCHRHNYHYVVFEIDPHEAGLHRDDLCRILQAENVVARRYFHPGCHRMPPYARSLMTNHAPLPWTEQIADRVLVLPTGPALADDDVEAICDIVELVIAHAAEVRQLPAA